jgi:dihydroorotase
MKTLIKNVRIVNEGSISNGDVLIAGERIEQVGKHISADLADHVVEGSGRLLIPGVIDDQVHFREPGLVHKADIYHESRAALAGGVTSYMEMPNTNPPTLTRAAVEDKFSLAGKKSPVNHSFYLGASLENIEEIRRADPKRVAGIKVFMGSSTGNMLVDDMQVLEKIFQDAPTLIATHCEDTPTIVANEQLAREKYGEHVPFREHANIRSAEACHLSSSLAVDLAKRFDSRLHVLHLSTAREMELFKSGPVSDKKITAEVCVHHLWFEQNDYDIKGAHIKWNPSVKTADDRAALRQALNDDRLDCIATDHAPHTLEEKAGTYFQAPSGGPLVQFSLLALLDLWREGIFSLERIVQKACHAPADIYAVEERGYIREGYYADLVLIDPDKPYLLEPELILSKCAWSPFTGHTFKSSIDDVWVNGVQKVKAGEVIDESPGMALRFSR